MSKSGSRQLMALAIFGMVFCSASGLENGIEELNSEETPFTARFMRMSNDERLALMNQLARIYRSEQKSGQPADASEPVSDSVIHVAGNEDTHMQNMAKQPSAQLEHHPVFLGSPSPFNRMQSWDRLSKRRAGGKLCYINPIACFGRRQRQAS